MHLAAGSITAAARSCTARAISTLSRMWITHWQSGLIADITVDKTGFQVESLPWLSQTPASAWPAARRAALLNDFATLSEQIRDERTALKLWETSL